MSELRQQILDNWKLLDKETVTRNEAVQLLADTFAVIESKLSAEDLEAVKLTKPT